MCLTLNHAVVMVVAGAGTNERKLKLAMELLEKCSPAAICGRSLDLVALGEMVLEKYSNLDDDNDDDNDDDDDDVDYDDDDNDKECRKERSKPTPLIFKMHKIHPTRSPRHVRKVRYFH